MIDQQPHPDHLAALAEAVGLTIPPPCVDGVLANLALLRRHARIVSAWDDPLIEPAEVFLP